MQGATHLYEYSRSLARMGQRVHVIACARKDEKSFEIFDRVIVQRIQMSAPLGVNLLGKLRFCKLVIRKLWNLMDAEHIDIIHMFALTGSFPVRVVNAILRSSKRTKWLYDIRTGSVSSMKILCSVTNLIIKLESRLYDGVFIIDEMIRDLVLNDNVFIAPLGVDLDLFNNDRDRSILFKYGVKNDDIVLVYLGNLSPARKIHILIEAFSLAVKKVDQLFLIVLGIGSDLERLQLLVSKLGLSQKILFLGYIGYRQVPSLLSASDIGIAYIPITPEYNVQPPQKTIEYLACSLPVIATSTRGNKRYITHEMNGLLTKDDPYSFSDAIVRLSTNDDLRKTLSKNARPSVENYESRKIAKHFILTSYRRIINAK